MMLGTLPSERVLRRIEALLDQTEEAVDRRDSSVVNELAEATGSGDAENDLLT